MAERGWPGEQHRRPATLVDAEPTGMSDEHPLMDPHELAPAKHSRDVGVSTTQRHDLPASDHAGLSFDQLVELVTVVHPTRLLPW
jgi:hypothetical protein